MCRSHGIGDLLEIKRPDKLVKELFSGKHDFNIWLTKRDLVYELV